MRRYLQTINKNHKFLICFIGIDGSGKTTCAQWLVRWLKNNGYTRTDYVWNRPYSRLMNLISLALKAFSLRGEVILEKNEEKSKIRRIVTKNKILTFLYKYLLILDFSISTIYRLLPRLLLKHNVVCDRYIYDVVVELTIGFNYDINDTKHLMNLIKGIVPKPTITFLIDLNEEIAIKRKKDIHSIQFLSLRRNIYKQMNNYYNTIILDGDKPLQELKNDIKNILYRILSFKLNHSIIL